MNQQPYPWQHQLWSALAERRRRDRLPHAILLSGPAGLGKRRFARVLAQTLLCTQPEDEGLPCGSCRSCVLYEAGTHPDLMTVEPDEPGKQILIDAIRRVRDYAALTSQYSKRKVVLIEPAESMNRNAANSLLKTLEEPSAQTVLLLLSAQPALLLPTIRSRCQAVRFRRPPVTEALRWLQGRLPEGEDSALLLGLAHGAPLRALALVEEGELQARDAVLEELEAVMAGRAGASNLAEIWHKRGLELSLQWLYSWVSDLIRVGAGVPDRVRNSDRLAALQAQAERVDLAWLFSFLEAVMEARRLARTQVNAQLMLEALLLDWDRATRRT